MLCSPTKVPAVIIQALLPVSSQLGTAAAGKLLRFAGGVYLGLRERGVRAQHKHQDHQRDQRRSCTCSSGTSLTLIGMLSESELDSFTSPRLSLHVI